jgi:translation initiation factor IF-3
MDFGKFQYEQKKQAKQQKKQRAGLVKEIRLSMKIGAHDLEYRLKKARGFLEEGQKVKFNLMMKGRENANPKAAMQRVKDIVAEHIPEAEAEADPVRAGRSISMVVAPPKGGFKDPVPETDESGADSKDVPTDE